MRDRYRILRDEDFYVLCQLEKSWFRRNWLEVLRANNLDEVYKYLDALRLKRFNQLNAVVLEEEF